MTITLHRSSTFNEATLINGKKFELKYDLNNNRAKDDSEADRLVEERTFAWDWPFCTDGKYLVLLFIWMKLSSYYRLRIHLNTKHTYAYFIILLRDISRYNETTKRLKRVRKVYRLPDHYDVSTTTTTMYDWAVVVEAHKREKNRPLLRRVDTLS
uniref:DDE_Tnp_1_7 domain-containing protein n=1 Tax=Heterorhabditis bacteriophora TaxID=37862 RepID=A0A1I7WTK8_HETBA